MKKYWFNVLILLIITALLLQFLPLRGSIRDLEVNVSAAVAGKHEIIQWPDAVRPDKTWVLTFTSSVDIQTVTAERIKVFDGRGQTVPIRIITALDGMSVRIQPVDDLPSGDYTLETFSGIADVTGRVQPDTLEIKFSTDGNPEPDAIEILPARITLEPGQTTRFTASLIGGSTDSVITWSVSAPGYALTAQHQTYLDRSGTGAEFIGSIKANGFYQAPVRPGNYYVQASCPDFPALQATVVVTVSDPNPSAIDLELDASSLDAIASSVLPGGLLILKARVYNRSAAGQRPGGSILRFMINDRIIDEVPFYLDAGQNYEDVRVRYYMPDGEYTDLSPNETKPAIIKAVVDPYNELAETNETNNTLDYTIAVRYRASSPIREDGSLFSVDATGLTAYSIKDDAAGDRVSAAQPGQSLRLRANITYTSSDTQTQNVNVKFLVNGVVILSKNRTIYSRTAGSSLVECDYQIPFNQSEPIDFRVLLSDGQTASISIPVLALDLAVKSGDLYWDPNYSMTAKPGQYLYLHAVLKNMASISFANEDQRIAWRVLIDGEEYAEGDFTNKFDTLNVSPVYLVPANQTEPILFTVITDVYDQISESDETNNFATIEIPILNNGLVKPNYIVSSDDLTCIATPVIPGSHIILQAAVHNQGAAFPAIGQSPVVAFKINGQEVSRKTVNRLWLQPLQSELVSADWTAPLGLTGQPVFEVVIDPDNLIIEADETDNSASKTLEVARPDLDVTDNPLSSAPDPAVTGQTVELRAIVKNNGSAVAINPVIRFFADGVVVGNATVGQINGASAGTALFEWLIPDVSAIELPYQTLAGVSGRMDPPADITRTYQIHVVADPEQALAEDSESNNISPTYTLTAAVPTSTKFVYIHVVDVLGDVSAATIVLTAADGSTASVETGEDGWCCFTGVPQGAYTYAINMAGYHPFTGQGATQDYALQYKDVYLERTGDFVGLSGPDSDGDLLADDEEAKYGTDPHNPDTDGDGVIDGQDLSPTCNPEDPTPEYLQKPGMVRFDQDIGAYGLDGWVEVWDMEFHLSTGDDLYYSKTDENSGSRVSDMSPATISKAVDRLFSSAGFKSCGITPIDAMSDEYPEKTADHVSEDHYFYEADTLHRTEYRFYYDYLVDFQRVSLKNSKELLYPSENTFFNYLLFPVKTRVNSNQSFNFQFTQSGLSDQIYNYDELLYRDLGFQYTFYTSLDFDNDATVPKETMIAMVDSDGSDRFNFSINLPADKALLSGYYLKITPVWVDGNNGKVDISPATLNWNLTGLTREIQYSLNADCSSDKLTESIRNLAGFNTEIPTMQSVLDLQSSASSFVWHETVTSLTYDPSANENERFALVEFQLDLTRCTRIGVGSVEAGMNLTRLSSVINHPKVAKLDDLPAGTLYQQSESIMDGFGVATGVITLYSNGLEAWKAWQNGENVEVAYYTAKAIGGGASAGLSFYKISTNVVATASRTGRFALKTTDKVSIGIAAVVGAVEFSYNLYKYNSTTDPIKKSSYGEKMGSTTLDTGLAIATTFYPPLIAFSATWMLIVEVFGYFTDWGLSYKIAQTPGTAIVFLYEYWWSEDIPSQFAEEAYGFILDTLMEHLRIMNLNGVPFVPVFVDPQLE